MYLYISRSYCPMGGPLTNYPMSPIGSFSYCNQQTWNQETLFFNDSIICEVNSYLPDHNQIHSKHVIDARKKKSGPNPLSHGHIQYCWSL